MKKLTIQNNLKKKGWVEKEIDHALSVVFSKKEVLLLEKLTLWFALFASIFANFVFSLSLVPVVLYMPVPIILLIVVIFGIVFGLLIDLFIKDIDYLTHKHYLAAGVILPIISVINIFISYRFTALFSNKLNIDFPYIPHIIAILYIISFSIPHYILTYIRYRK